MKTAYVVRALAVRDSDGGIAGWVRGDVLADGSRSTDEVFLRDGTARPQAEALKAIARNHRLMYGTAEEAVRDGIERLRRAHGAGSGVRPDAS